MSAERQLLSAELCLLGGQVRGRIHPGRRSSDGSPANGLLELPRWS
ncbi:hypothetical protein [Kribbella alba]